MTERPDEPLPPKSGRGITRGRFALILAAALVAGGAVGLAGVYGMGGLARNGDASANATGPEMAVAGQSSLVDGECSSASETARRIQPLVKGEVAAFSPTLTPRRVPDLAFTDGAGKPLRLADLGGKVRLVNVWATWCAPCRKEMPALDRLQGELGGDDFGVVAVNVDTRDPQKPRDFLKETGVQHLAFYADEKAQAFQDLRSAGRGFGLPATLLVDAKGCEIGFMAGPADWAGPDALALLRAALGTAAGG
ncbi:TlpA family protein disulfide reductase [Ancylobacter sp. 6x-1]|uniref:TlpA family protein disulfide reductase n=1 Tax=Ancylobacter crimeensis TaxID=2579147 RepID=A0ABT0DCD4_9HYPH|nr:TlpA disulfide reductase family protein [Ancylobacter crimeensis]MCK0197559.1 TlpA family protein disulfide reductase [Ancylobacter crimeensis]